MALNLKHQTAEQFAQWYWNCVQKAYRSKDKYTYTRLLTWLYNRVQAGDITNAQARASFNLVYGRSLTAAQWNKMVQDKILPIVQRYGAMEAEGDL